MWTKEFWADTAERAIYTACETAIGVMVGATILSEVDWAMVGSASALSAIVTVLKCILVGIAKPTE